MTALYSELSFPEGPTWRPYAYIDMVTTIDGKILSGERDEHVIDLGSETDHAAMKRLALSSDAVLVGGATLRTTLDTWNPETRLRIVVSRSGDLPFQSKFFSNGRAVVAVPTHADVSVPEDVEVIRTGEESVDLKDLFRLLRSRGVARVLVLGGSELNAQLIGAGLIDELFLTIAPKVKLGRDVPTYADGVALPRQSMQKFQIVEHHVIGDEIFLRYRRVLEE